MNTSSYMAKWRSPLWNARSIHSPMCWIASVYPSTTTNLCQSYLLEPRSILAPPFSTRKPLWHVHLTAKIFKSNCFVALVTSWWNELSPAKPALKLSSAVLHVKSCPARNNAILKTQLPQVRAPGKSLIMLNYARKQLPWIQSKQCCLNWSLA